VPRHVVIEPKPPSRGGRASFVLSLSLALALSGQVVGAGSADGHGTGTASTRCLHGELDRYETACDNDPLDFGTQADVDQDGPGDLRDPDDDGDGDGFLDTVDNCRMIANDQTDRDDDQVGDACDLVNDGFSQVGLFDLWEREVVNSEEYFNPFDHAEIELRTTFSSPSGRIIEYWGFHDGDGRGGQTGTVWKQRFMCDEAGTWTYSYFWEGSGPRPAGGAGSFQCSETGAKPGPWRVYPWNHRWFITADGSHFLPKAFHTRASMTRIDWEDSIDFAVAKGFNTLITGSINTKVWGDGWPNPTPFATVDAATKAVDYERFNLRAWTEWDTMIEAAGKADLNIGCFNGPAGDYGGQSGDGTRFPPDGLEYHPALNTPFDTAQNLNVIRYLVARQAAFWNLAYWTLYSTEIFEIKDEQEVIDYGEHLAAVTPFGRLITAQDIEQVSQAGDFDWLTRMHFPAERKLNTFQTGQPWDTGYQDAAPNNAEALAWIARGYPVLGTESLWEGQPRATRPLRVIWGTLTAGAHVMWADWSYDDGIDGGRWGAIGRAWLPVKPVTEHLFRIDQLGADTLGDEQLLIALNALEKLEYWRMRAHNELVAGSTEAYALAEPGMQYLIYAPAGGTVELDLQSAPGLFDSWWLDPRTGAAQGQAEVQGGATLAVEAPDSSDWVLVVVAIVEKRSVERRFQVRWNRRQRSQQVGRRR
jgi:hypothetical protein